MSYFIIDDCINCGACEVECPTEAIYKPGKIYKINGKYFNALSNEHFFIVPELCNECVDFDELKCISICLMDAIK